MVTENLWGERWSKLVTNVMGNGLSACTGMITRDMVKNDSIRHFSNRLGSEAIRVGQALGYVFDEVSHMDPETLARAGEGDPEAQKKIDEHRLGEANRPGGGEHRPSMGQDMVKGRRTEIQFLNGFVVREGEKVGISAPTNAILTEIVTRVERGELKPDPKHIIDLRLN
jgi:2-dehydropantoate 2-reductase